LSDFPPGHNGGMSDERQAKRGEPFYWLRSRSWRFWLVLIVVVPILYIASFGPVCWVTSRSPTPDRWDTADAIYSPILWTWVRGPEFAKVAIREYANLYSARIIMPAEWPAGCFFIVSPHRPETP
jgi:hypothetical protein